MQRDHIEQSGPGHVNINVKKELSKHTKLGAMWPNRLCQQEYQ